MDYRQLTPQALVRACATTTDPVAWDQFIIVFTPIVSSTTRRVLVRSGMFTAEIHEEIIQDVFVKAWENDRALCKRMDCGPEGYPFAYMKKATANLTLDFIKAERTQKRGAGRVDGNLDDIPASSQPHDVGSSHDIESQALRS